MLGSPSLWCSEESRALGGQPGLASRRFLAVWPRATFTPSVWGTWWLPAAIQGNCSVATVSAVRIPVCQNLPEGHSTLCFCPDH